MADQMIQGRHLPWDLHVSANGQEWRDYANLPGAIPVSGSTFTDLCDFCTNGVDVSLMSAGALLYASSSSGSDANVNILIQGLDENYNFKSKTLNLDGQTKKVIPGAADWLRVFLVQVQIGDAPVGDVYVYEDDTVTAGVPDTAAKIKGKILIGNGATLMALGTVPAGKIGMIPSATIGASAASNVEGRLMVTPVGGNPYVVAIPSGIPRDIVKVSIPIKVPAMADVRLQGRDLAATAELSGEFTMVLADSAS